MAIHYHQNRAAADETLASLAGDGHAIYQADIANPEAVSRLVDAVAAEMGNIDILINNAGVYTEHPIASVSYDEWQRQWAATLATNLVGAANLCYCAAQHMIARGGGGIVNVSSRGAFRGEPTAPAYGASQSGHERDGTIAGALALAPHNIAVVTVAPGRLRPTWRRISKARKATQSATKARSSGWRRPATWRRWSCSTPRTKRFQHQRGRRRERHILSANVTSGGDHLPQLRAAQHRDGGARYCAACSVNLGDAAPKNAHGRPQYKTARKRSIWKQIKQIEPPRRQEHQDVRAQRAAPLHK
ncbi:MAG: SDR family oxidoreductase [Anaerolineae bacterium]